MALRLLYQSKRSSPHQSKYRRRVKEEARKLKETLFLFWEKRPSLLVGISFALGIAFIQSFFWPLFFVFFSLFFPFFLEKNRKLIFGLLFFAVGMFYGFSPKPTLSVKPVEGNFWITSTTFSPNFFHKRYKHKGIFLTKDQKIPCVYYQNKGKRLSSHKLYWVKATLQESKSNVFIKASPHSFLPLKNRFSLEAFRRKAKDKIFLFLQKNIKNSDSRDLLYTLFTSEQVNPYLSFTFSRLGLSHLLAISGFHFALLVGGLSWVFSLVFSEKKQRFAIFFIATLYFLFLGPLPSVFRAWLLLFFYTLAYLLRKKTDFLNLLGASLFVELVFFPEYIFHAGFQLSFLCCMALALGYKPLEALWGDFFKKRSDKEKKELSFLTKGTYFLGRSFRELLSLQMAITLFTLPVILFWFESFPLYSFIYNLFVPFFLAGVLGLLLLSLSLSWIPYLSSWILYVLEGFTTFSLRCILHPPKTYEYIIKYNNINLKLVLSYLLLLFFLFVFLKRKENYLFEIPFKEACLKEGEGGKIPAKD